MRVLTFSFFLLASFFLQANQISKITFEGLNTISRGTVLSYLPLEVGDDVNEKSINDSIDSLKKTNFFSDIKISFDKDVLLVTLIENPTIKYIDFKGYKEDEVLNANLIEKIIANNSLKSGEIFVAENLEKLLKELKIFYNTNAYYEVLLSLNSKKDSKNRIGIEINIDEGERALIGSFKINGIKNFDSDDIYDLFDIGEPDFFLVNFFSERDIFSTRLFEAGIESMTNFYNSEGFLDANIANKKVSFNPETKKIDIEIDINEGKRYLYNDILFNGDLANVTVDKLKSFISLEKGDVFKRKKIIDSIQQITKLYQNMGFAYAKVNSRAIPSSSNNFLDLEISIIPDSKVYVNRIDISGNFNTQDDVIRRKLNILEGQIYSKELIEESVNRVKRLGYFSSVDYQMNRHKYSPDMVDIKLEVIETKTGEMSIGLSHSNATGAALNAGISQKNILGTGNTLNANFTNSDALEEISFYFKNPYFGKDGQSISYGFFDKTLDAANIDTSSYMLDEKGFNLGYGLPLSKNSSIDSDMRFSSINLKCGSDLATLYESDQCNTYKSSNDLTVSLMYSTNSLNDYFFATEGQKNSIKSTLSLPVADYKYYRLELSHKSYYPALNNKTIKFSSRVNLGSGYGGQDLPFYKRYFEGGASSIRGFDFNSLGAKYSDGSPKGGEFSFLSSLALSSSLDFLGLDNENMRIGPFVDLGTISEKVSTLEFNDFRSSAGIQFSWLTPIGPIGFHYAQPVVKKSGDSIETFSFELGANF